MGNVGTAVTIGLIVLFGTTGATSAAAAAASDAVSIAHGGAGRGAETRATQAAVAVDAPPASAFTVYDEVADGARLTPLLRAQVERAWAQDARRQARFDAVRTEADLLALQRELKQTMLDAIGGLPETRTPLNARIVGTERMEGYRIERVLFESLPGIHVTALVYVPESVGGETNGEAGAAAAAAPPRRRPAVLLACGHSPLGKSFENYQRIAARLARLGFIVICWDPVGQGERSQFWDAARGDTRYNLVCGEHAVMGGLAVLAGTSLVRWMVWDGMRAVDYLLTRDDVDASRIAITGTSGGGFQTTWIGALDERIAVVAPSAYITSLPMRMANRTFEDPVSDPEQDPFTLVSRGVDHAGLLLAAYPRRIHVSSVARDFFPIEGSRKTMRTVRALYARGGHADRVAFAESYHTHSYSDENQASAFAFIARAFGVPLARPLTAFSLPKVTLLKPEQLRVTTSGQVRVDLPGRPLTDVIREYYDAHKAARRMDVAAFYRQIAHAEGNAAWTIVEDRPERAPLAPRTAAWMRVGTSTQAGVTIDRYLLRYGAIQEIPLLHLRATAAAGGAADVAPRSTPRRVLLHVDLRGKASPATWEALRATLAAGIDIVSIDLPGTGEGRMRYRVRADEDMKEVSDIDMSDHPVASVLANHAYNGLLSGRPYLIDALETIEIARAFTRARIGAGTLQVGGTGDAATLAAVAATIWPDMPAAPLPGGRPFRWREAVEQGTELWPIHYLLPGGAYADMPGAAPVGAAAR